MLLTAKMEIYKNCNSDNKNHMDINGYKNSVAVIESDFITIETPFNNLKNNTISNTSNCIEKVKNGSNNENYKNINKSSSSDIFSNDNNLSNDDDDDGRINNSNNVKNQNYNINNNNNKYTIINANNNNKNRHLKKAASIRSLRDEIPEKSEMKTDENNYPSQKY